MKKYHLHIVNPNVDYWYNILFRWKKELKVKKTTFVYGRVPPYGIAILSKVIVPYRQRTIDRLSLPQDQKLLLILDLHYSHHPGSSKYSVA
jgi:hypothetical protein